jgi:hypothetical protein
MGDMEFSASPTLIRGVDKTLDAGAGSRYHRGKRMRLSNG